MGMYSFPHLFKTAKTTGINKHTIMIPNPPHNAYITLTIHTNNAHMITTPIKPSGFIYAILDQDQCCFLIYKNGS